MPKQVMISCEASLDSPQIADRILFLSFLKVIIENVIQQYRRSSSIRQRRGSYALPNHESDSLGDEEDADLLNIIDVLAGVEDRAETRSLLSNVFDELRRLAQESPTKRRMVDAFVLTVVFGLPIQQVAQQLDMQPLQTRDAIKHLRQYLRRVTLLQEVAAELASDTSKSEE